MKEKDLLFSATLQLAVLLPLFLSVWKYGDRKRRALFHSCMGDQRGLSALCHLVVREGWNAASLPNYISPSGNLSKCGGRKNPQSCFPTTGTGQVRGARTSQAGLEGGKVEKLRWSSGKQQTEEGVRGKGESRVKSCMPGCCRVDFPAGK